MAKRSKPKAKKPIEQYERRDKKRVSNPPVGLVDASTDTAEETRTYAYDPHLDPTLQWAGKAERNGRARRSAPSGWKDERAMAEWSDPERIIYPFDYPTVKSLTQSQHVRLPWNNSYPLSATGKRLHDV